MKRLALLVLLLANLVPAEIRTLTILHVNDFHARLLPMDNHHGGAAYLAAAIQRERKGCTDCILLNAGDLVQGTPVSTLFRGAPIYDIGNLFGFDAATLGNHEFDYGWKQAQAFMRAANYPIVTSNLVNDAGALFTAKPWVILKVNGLRVGIIGAMLDVLPTMVFPSDLGEWHEIPSLATVRKYALELRPQCDIVIVLGHISSGEETAFLSLPETPVVISGHAHNGIPKEQSQGDHVMVRVRANGEDLGRLELKVDTEKKAPVSWVWKKITVDSEHITPDPAVAAQVKVWEDKVTELVDQPIGTSSRERDKPGVKTLLEDAMKEATGADLTYMNPGGVRDILPKGLLLLRHVWNIMPFDDGVVYGSLKGRELPAALAQGQQIDPERDYKVVLPDFVATQMGLSPRLSNHAGLLRDVLAEFIRKHKVID